MKILLIGKNGQLGSELNATLPFLGDLLSMDYPQIDIADAGSIRSIIRENAPDLIINAAAYTNVDKAESEAQLVHAVNAVAPGVMAEEARRLNAGFIHYSTDYVFDGTKGKPYIETDLPNPVNIYGASKLEGESLVRASCDSYLIIRTSWLYSIHQGGFVAKVLQWAHQQEIVSVVDDQVGNPTWARSLAESSSRVIAQGITDPAQFLKQNAGIYHLGGAGWTNRYEWAKKIIEFDPRKSQQKIKELLPSKTSKFPTPAKRPLNTSLLINKFSDHFNIQYPGWIDCLRAAFSTGSEELLPG